MVADVVDYLREYPPPPCVATLNSCRIIRTDYRQDAGIYDLDFVVMAPSESDFGEGIPTIEIRIDYHRWCKRSVNVVFKSDEIQLGKGVMATWIQDRAYGDGGLVLKLDFDQVAADARVSLMLQAGIADEGPRLNGGKMEILDSETGKEEKATAPLPIQSSKPQSISSPMARGDWGSPGRLSLASTNAASAWDLPASRAAPMSSNFESTLSSRRLSVSLGRPSGVDRTQFLASTAETAFETLLSLWKPELATNAKIGSAVDAHPEVPLLRDSGVVQGFSPMETFAALRSFECRKLCEYYPSGSMAHGILG